MEVGRLVVRLTVVVVARRLVDRVVGWLVTVVVLPLFIKVNTLG